MMLVWFFGVPLAMCAPLIALDVMQHWISPWRL